jgi:hypothetical protein
MRRKSPLEADLNAKLVSWLNEIGLFSIKLTAMYSRGVPDRLIFIPGGRPLLLELKRLGKRPTKLQDERISELLLLGYDAAWTDNLVTAKTMVNTSLEVAQARGKHRR